MDVDDPTRHLLAEVVGQHLHVARKNHEVGVISGNELHELGLRPGLIAASDRDVVKRYVVVLHQLREIRMVGDDARDVAVQTAHTPAIEQVIQAVPELTHHDDELGTLLAGVELPLQLEGLRGGGERRTQTIYVHRASGFDSHEEPSGFGIHELLTLDDVMPISGQKTAHALDDAYLVWA